MNKCFRRGLMFAGGLGVALIGWLLPTGWARAESATSDAETPAVAARPAVVVPGFTPEREAAALLFVRTHHPELATLLERLKLSNPSAYQKAVQDLFRASERLAQIQERQPARYELHLRDWQVNSQIELLLARLTVADTPRLRKQLRAALAEQAAVQREMLLWERQRLESRLETIDRLLSRDDKQLAQDVDQRVERALRRVDRGGQTKREPARAKAPDGAANPNARRATPADAPQATSDPDASTP